VSKGFSGKAFYFDSIKPFGMLFSYSGIYKRKMLYEHTY